MGRKAKDITGQRFGRLVAIRRVDDLVCKNGAKKAQWLCQCDCGNQKVALKSCLDWGYTVSCGCQRAESASKTHKKHGLTRERIYNIWCDMRQRCDYNKSPSYKNYGGRGISYCEEWKSFENFLEWAKASGYRADLTIDRIDVNGNYCPENCRWADWVTQNRNKRNSVNRKEQ